MSLIKTGNCTKCGEWFYWSIGHPSWWPFNTDHAIAKWWFGLGTTCPDCAPSPPEEPQIQVCVGIFPQKDRLQHAYDLGHFAGVHD